MLCYNEKNSILSKYEKKHQISVKFYPDIFVVPIDGAITKQVCEKIYMCCNALFI